MKKRLLSKLLVLVVMGLFSITSCQNEEVNNPQIDNNEVALQEVIRQLDGFKVSLNDAMTDLIKESKNDFELLSQDLLADPQNDELQTLLIAKGIQIEALNTYQTRAAEDYPTVPSKKDIDWGDNHKRVYLDVLKNYYNTIAAHLAALKIFIENNIGGTTVDLEPLTNRVAALETALPLLNGRVAALETTIPTLATKVEVNAARIVLETSINTLRGELQAKIDLINTLLGIADDPPASSVLDGIASELADIDTELLRLDDVKANKFKIEEKVYDLKTVYDELIDITNALDARLTQAEADIDDLQERVVYIETVEIPTIWEGLEILHSYIGDVYNSLDKRVSSLTFKPEYDFGDGLSSLILVKGLSEWSEMQAEAGKYEWQPIPEGGSVYKAFTWLKYNVSPSNVTLDDFEVVDLLYQTTTIVTRTTSDPLLKIVDDTERYPITLEYGVLSVPVLIHKDLNPIIQTSFDKNASKNIKVALRIKNLKEPDEYNLPEEPEHHEVTPAPIPSSLQSSDAVDSRYVVSSEYVTVWLGLFDGRIAVRDEELDTQEPEPYPTEITIADFIDKTNDEYPSVNLLVTNDDISNSIDISESVLALYYDKFEKKYAELLNNDFEKNYTLTYTLTDLDNNADTFVALSGSTLTVTDKQKSIGETLAVLVKAKVDDKVHALGFVRVLIIGEDKELITITNKLTLAETVINCSVPVEFTNKSTVQAFVNSKILGDAAVSSKTKITDATVLYQKYTGIKTNNVSVSNSNAELAQLTEEDLKELFIFTYVPGEQYIKGTISDEAPIGTYTVVTTLSSNERIPDIQITWQFTVKTPELIWIPTGNDLVINSTLPDLVNIYSPSPSEATFDASISDLFKKHANGGFEYTDLNGQVCPGFVDPYFVFTDVPVGYNIASDGKSVTKNSATVAVIEKTEDDFRIKLIENDEVVGLVGSDAIRIAGKGLINGGVHTIFQPFKVVFANPLVMVFPNNASFGSNNLYLLNFYNNNNGVINVVRDYNGSQLSIYRTLPSKIFIDHYGVDQNYDTSFTISTSLSTNETIYSPYEFDVENAVFNPAITGVTVIIDPFQTADTRSYYGKRTPIRYRFRIVNNSGDPLPSGLEVKIPAIIKHRWGFTSEDLIIKVN